MDQDNWDDMVREICFGNVHGEGVHLARLVRKLRFLAGSARQAKVSPSKTTKMGTDYWIDPRNKDDVTPCSNWQARC